MVLYTPEQQIPYVEPTDTPVTYAAVSQDIAFRVDDMVKVSPDPPPTDPPPARDGLLWIQVV